MTKIREFLKNYEFKNENGITFEGFVTLIATVIIVIYILVPAIILSAGHFTEKQAVDCYFDQAIAETYDQAYAEVSEATEYSPKLLGLNEPLSSNPGRVSYLLSNHAEIAILRSSVCVNGKEIHVGKNGEIYFRSDLSGLNTILHDPLDTQTATNYSIIKEEPMTVEQLTAISCVVKAAESYDAAELDTALAGHPTNFWTTAWEVWLYVMMSVFCLAVIAFIFWFLYQVLSVALG